MVWLALLNLSGNQTWQDHQLGLRYLHQAADRGHPDAEYLAGESAEGFGGGPADPKVAMAWYERAARQ